MLSEIDSEELSQMFRLLGDASRLRIVFTCLEEAVSVGDIADRLDLTPSLVSHHLRLLRSSRILVADRRGKQIFYQAADDHIRTMLRNMAAHAGEQNH